MFKFSSVFSIWVVSIYTDSYNFYVKVPSMIFVVCFEIILIYPLFRCNNKVLIHDICNCVEAWELMKL